MAAATGGCATSGSASATACNVPGVTPDQIKLGFIYPDSGALSPAFAAARAGVDARLGRVNENGGVHGRKIVYDWRDDQGSADANNQAAHNLVDQDNVFGLLESSATAAGGAPYLATNGIPVTGMATEAVWSQYRNMFAFSHPTDGLVDTYGKFAHLRGARRFVLLQTALTSTASDAGTRYLRSMQAAGLEFAGVVNYTADADSLAAVAQRIRATNADTIVAITQPDSLVKILSQLRSTGTNLKLVLSIGGYDRELLQAFGASMAGIVIPIFYRPFEAGGPAIANYLSAMAEFAPQVQHPEQDIGMMSYIEADMFIRGLEQAGDCPTRQGFIDGLRSLTHYDADGLIPAVDFKNDPGRPTTCYSFVQANSTGTAFDVVAQDLCGKEIKP